MDDYHPIINVVDDDDAVRNSIVMSLSTVGHVVKDYNNASSFLSEYNNEAGCLIADIQMPGMNGLELQQKLLELKLNIPIIFITGHGDIPMSVQAIKAGAVEFLEKPFDRDKLIECIDSALQIDAREQESKRVHKEILQRLNSLTKREREVFDYLIMDNALLTNKDISEKLEISKRTIEVHRSSIMNKMSASNRAELIAYAQICNLENS